MRSNTFKSVLIKSGLAASILMLASGVSFAQSVSLTAAATTTTLPDGSVVPMWGYSCSAAAVAPATCAALNPASAATLTTPATWSPVVITVPTGQDLTINLTNNLTFGANSVPTSLVIVGQLGGGLGSTATSTVSPTHAPQSVTWPIANSGPTNTPPPQGNRVQSFSTEVAAGATTALCWGACGGTTPALRPGTYLLESGTHPSIQGPMGLYGILVVTTAPGTTAGIAYPAAGMSPAVTYSAEIPVLLSEIDPIQNSSVSAAVNTAGFAEGNVWSGQLGLPSGCGNPLNSDGSANATFNTCYPPAVNYTPLYYLVNGVAFNNKSTATSALNSLFAPLAPQTTSTTLTGGVLVRLVNAGLHMHVPAIVGSLTTPAVVPTGVTAAQVAGFSLVAEDGNPLPGVSRVQNEVFMAAGKTYDVMIDAPATGGSALPLFDRELSLSGNSTGRDEGMLAYLSVNGNGLPAAAAAVATVTANPDTYASIIAGQTLTVSDPAKGVIANDVNVYGVHVVGTVPAGLTFNTDGTFVYTAGTPTSFTYCGNGATSGAACALVTLSAQTLEASSGITCPGSTFTATVATSLSIKPPGILAGCVDAAGYPVTVNAASVTSTGFSSLSVDPNGGFNATVAGGGTASFSFKAQNSQGVVASASATVTLTFPTATGLIVNVVDGRDKVTPVTDYRWIIEEDRTFYINPNCTDNPPKAGCPSSAAGIVPTFGTNFHTSYMPVVAAGCTGALSCESGQTVSGAPAVCDVGNGVCRTTGTQQAMLDPSTVHLDPNKHYYISVLPGDAANSFENVSSCLSNATPSCGHGMGGAQIACVPTAPAVTCTAAATIATTTPSPNGAWPASVTVLVQPNPFPPSKLSVFVFEDDFPLNGEQDGGGGIDVLSPHEPGLGGFFVTLFDDAGGSGDATGQMTYDMFNMPLSNGLSGTIDPSTGLDACPVSKNATTGFDGTTINPTGITGTIVTCPKYESDGVTLSPLSGSAVVSNLMPGRYGVVATPGADRIARGEEWLQTNTLDGQKAHDSFLRIGEPSFFQEFGPAGYHVSIGFANPKIISDRLQYVCNGTDPNISGTNCTNSVTGTVTTERMSRTPDERLYSSGDNASFAFTQCYVSFGDPDGEDFAFTKCDSNGQFTLSGLPDGDWRITVFDQWNDMLVDGLSTPVRLGGGATTALGDIATNQWQTNIYTKSYLDLNNNGIQDGTEPGLSLVSTNIRFRDGSYSNFNNTDLSGNAGFNEVFPLFSWYVVDGYSTRYKSTGTHVVYDSGGPADGTLGGGISSIGAGYANTLETVPLPSDLRVPGAYYCTNADCTDAATPYAAGGTGGTTGRIDPPTWFGTEGWQGFSGENNFIEFGKKPYAVGETGGIFGEVIYASTRPFDDPALLIHTSWTPDVPGVTINLYKEGLAADGVTTVLSLIDSTKTSSWDDWAQGVRTDGRPNMNCPGQGTATGTNADLFFYSIFNQPQWLDLYANGGANGGATHTQTLYYNQQFKCYDGMHNWNQVQPAPYDGMYQFPSVTAYNPTTGAVAGTNCTACVTNPDSTDPYRYGGSATPVAYVSGTSTGAPMLPAGKYVVEMVVPPGYELVKEEDKNILIGDNYIAPATQEFAGLGNVFILPDQAVISAETAAGCDVTAASACNPQQLTQAFGRTTLPSHEGDTGSVEEFWPCVGASRVVPDYISLFPQSAEVAPFAGATRNLCDRKEVSLTEQRAALAKFWVFSSTHVAAHYTGVITDDYTSEFDPFSPQFGEKFSPPDLPISFKDWSGTEIARTYADHWGTYNGLTYSTWEVNPPNPTGYAPTMMVTCMNDPGTGATPDPLYNPEYSNFCYEIPFMPGQTQYMDTPVVPTSAFAGAGYNNPDCAYPDATPAVASVVSSAAAGPWVGATASVASVSLTGNGAYTGVPGVTFTGGGGSGAAATASMGLNNLVCNNCLGTTGNRYTAGAPTVTLGRPLACPVTDTATCIGATATANIAGNGGPNRRVGTVTLSNRGRGYTAMPSITITCTGSCVQVAGRGLSVSPAALPLRVVALSLTANGSGYATTPTVGFTGGGCSSSACAATATATLGTPVASGSLTITALGDQMVPNNAYSGPAATTAPYNQKKVLRHYGFGAAAGTVTVGGVALTGVSWSDSTITGSVPAGVPLCAVQQQAQYGGTGNAACGELVIKAANGKSSVDAVTVTIGGKAPTVLTAGQTIQSAIDAAQPGDLIIVPPGTYRELLLMWKPVRLQGVGAATSLIDASPHPAGKLDTWRAEVNCLFGLGLSGSPTTWSSSCAPTTWVGYNATANSPQVDRLPLEATVGWDAGLNGNLAELLQEPSLMGALEGAAITVLSKGVNFHGASPWDPTLLAGFPAGTTLLSGNVNATGGYSTGDSNSNCHTSSSNTTNPFPSNYSCNPSSIDGLGITDSSQGGGGIFVHGWGHNVQIANNRINSNAGTLSGGISVGQGEFPPAYFGGTAGATNAAPGSCQNSGASIQLPYCHELNVNIHNNAITSNSSTGDELFSATPAGGGGVTFCTGSDYYKFQYNWVCGNLSTGDGGGVAHTGFSYNADIEHNAFLFNQSSNPTIPTNGGGLLIMGAPDVDPACGATTDIDCQAPGLSDGSGPKMVINANLFTGNQAESGSGGALALQSVNGTDVVSFPTDSSRWNSISVTNNIINNNVAGWDGAGISLLDALNVNIINNTIMSNDTTASSGVLFNTLGAPLASTQGSNCIQLGSTTASCPQVAGVVSIQNSSVMTAPLAGVSVNCPTGHGTTGMNATCKRLSIPVLYNDLIFQNRSFYIGVGTLGTGTLNQQNVVALYNAFSATQVASEPTADATTANGAGVVVTGGTGACLPNTSPWDLGVRGDTGPTNHSGSGLPTVTLAPQFSFLTNAAADGYAVPTNTGANPTVISQYCNGSRTPPEFQSLGWQVPPGISDATVPNPLFNLTPIATVDEGNNWVNISWGPLTTIQPITLAALGNYAPAAGSLAIDYVPQCTPSSNPACAPWQLAPSTDFFGNARKTGTNPNVDAGAVETAPVPHAALSVTGGPLAFGSVAVGSASSTLQLGLHNTGTVGATGITMVFSSAQYSRPAGNPGTCTGTTLAAGGMCTINVVYTPTAAGASSATLTITANVAVTGSPVGLSGTGVAPVVAATLTPTTHDFGGVTRNCPGTTLAQILACTLDPIQIFTLTNTGNVNLTGITQATIGGANPAAFAKVAIGSTCGANGGGQPQGITTLAPGATCVVTMQFKPMTAQPTGVKSATVSVTSAAGTATSTLTGTAN